MAFHGPFRHAVHCYGSPASLSHEARMAGERGLHAHGLIVKIRPARRCRVTHYGRNVMGTSLSLREHHFPNVESGGMH